VLVNIGCVDVATLNDVNLLERAGNSKARVVNTNAINGGAYDVSVRALCSCRRKKNPDLLDMGCSQSYKPRRFVLIDRSLAQRLFFEKQVAASVQFYRELVEVPKLSRDR